MVEAGNTTNPFIPTNNGRTSSGDSPQKAGQPVYGLNPFANANQSPAVAKEWQPSAAKGEAEAIELRDMSSDEPEQLPWERKAAEIEARVCQSRWWLITVLDQGIAAEGG